MQKGAKMATKKKAVVEQPKDDIALKVAELQKKRADVCPQEQIEIDRKILEMTSTEV